MTCPTPEKIRFRSQVSAMARAKSASDWYGTQMGVYRCKCRKWHVFTMADSSSATVSGVSA